MKRLLIGMGAAGALWLASGGAAVAGAAPVYTYGAGQTGFTVNNVLSAGPNSFAFYAQTTSSGAAGRMYLREGNADQVVADVTCLTSSGSLVRLVGTVTQPGGTFTVGSTLVFDAADNDGGAEGQQPPLGDSFISSGAPGSSSQALCVPPTDPGLQIFRGDIFVSTAPGSSATGSGSGGTTPPSDSK